MVRLCPTEKDRESRKDGGDLLGSILVGDLVSEINSGGRPTLVGTVFGLRIPDKV